MDLENLNQLKVTDLKNLLKARGLSMVGVKSELIERLHAALLREASLNAGAGTGAIKVNEKEIDEDAILGDDDSIIGKPDDSLLHNEDLLLSEANIEITNRTIKSPIVGKPKAVITAASTAPVNKPKVSEVKATSTTVTTNPVSSLKQLASAKNILTAEQRKELRLQKFGNPNIKNRIERFGPVSEKPVNENEKLKQRVQRFGEAVSEKAKTIEEIERIEKRKERFGNVARDNKSSNGVKTISTISTDPLINKRQERFGVVDKPTGPQTFKRQRFAY